MNFLDQLMQLLMAGAGPGGVTNVPKGGVPQTFGPGPGGVTNMPKGGMPQNIPPVPPEMAKELAGMPMQPPPAAAAPAPAGPPPMPPGFGLQPPPGAPMAGPPPMGTMGGPTQQLPPPPPPAPLKLGQGREQMAGNDFRQKGMGLFGGGGGGGGFARFFADAAAGAAGAGGIGGAFATGAHGAMTNAKNRGVAQTQAERDAEKFGMDKRASGDTHAKTLADINKTLLEPDQKTEEARIKFITDFMKPDEKNPLAPRPTPAQAQAAWQQINGQSFADAEGKVVKGPDGRSYKIVDGSPVLLEEEQV